MPSVRVLLSVLCAAALPPVVASAAPVARFPDPSASPATPPAPAPQVRDAGDAGPARKPVWSSALVADIMRRATDHERRGDAAQAMAGYLDAIRIDPTYGPALLALARLRQAMGDPAEAERLCDRAVRLPPYAAQAFTLRAQLHRERGQVDAALADLEAAVERDPSPARLEALANAYVEQQAWPAALAIWRRILGKLEATPGAPGVADARIKVRALGVLAGDADPVTSGDASPSWVRRSLSRIARRQER